MDDCSEFDIKEIISSSKVVEYIRKLKGVDLESLSEAEINIILENIFLVI